MLFGVASIQLHSLTWLGLWSLSLGSWFVLWFWLRRFNLAEHERVEVGMPGMALALFAGPFYVAAAVTAILRRPLAYAVTAKGKLASGEDVSTFRLHLWWAAGCRRFASGEFRAEPRLSSAARVVDRAPGRWTSTTSDSPSLGVGAPRGPPSAIIVDRTFRPRCGDGEMERPVRRPANRAGRGQVGRPVRRPRRPRYQSTRRVRRPGPAGASRQ